MSKVEVETPLVEAETSEVAEGGAIVKSETKALELEDHSKVLDPAGKFMRKWDLLMLLLLGFTASVTPYEVSFVKSEGININLLFIVNRMVDFGFLLVNAMLTSVFVFLTLCSYRTWVSPFLSASLMRTQVNLCLKKEKLPFDTSSKDVLCCWR